MDLRAFAPAVSNERDFAAKVVDVDSAVFDPLRQAIEMMFGDPEGKLLTQKDDE
jgi:hypothetical protein